MKKESRIYIAGHTGLLGKRLKRELNEKGYKNIITRPHKRLDLRDQKAVERFFDKEKPEYVVLCAAKVGGIGANLRYPAQFIHDNIAINTNVIHASYLHNVKRLIFFGSSCCYPKDAPQPLKEEYLFTGRLEKTSQPYAVAKLAGMEMCISYNREYGTKFMVLIPATLYGPGDNFDLEEGHVLSSLLRRFIEAKNSGKKEITLWGTGRPRREFLYADDMAEAVHFFLNLKGKDINWEFPVINIGWGEDIPIKELAGFISKEIGYRGRIRWDRTRPDGVSRKIFSVEKMKGYDFHCAVPLRDGLRKVLNEIY